MSRGDRFRRSKIMGESCRSLFGIGKKPGVIGRIVGVRLDIFSEGAIADLAMLGDISKQLPCIFISFYTYYVNIDDIFAFFVDKLDTAVYLAPSYPSRIDRRSDDRMECRLKLFAKLGLPNKPGIFAYLPYIVLCAETVSNYP